MTRVRSPVSMSAMHRFLKCCSDGKEYGEKKNPSDRGLKASELTVPLGEFNQVRFSNPHDANTFLLQ